MNVTTALQGVQQTLAVLQALTALQLTAFLWPQQAVVEDGASFDFIVVGSGSAGSVIATRLSEIDGATVLLIEAGGDPPVESVVPGLYLDMKNTENDWSFPSVDDGYTQQFHKNPRREVVRGKMLGGSSSINFMIYTRGNWHDYDNWAQLTGDDTWSWENVLPYFKKSERLEDPVIRESPTSSFHGECGPLGVTKNYYEKSIEYLKAFEEIGNKVVLDTNANASLGYTETMFTIAEGVRQSTAYSFLRLAKHRPNLFVLKHTLASKILFDEYKNATGVEAILQDNTTATYKANKEVIISGGAINSPQLLMLSGIGPAEHLQNLGIPVISDLPVGQNLQDHVVLTMTHKMGNATPSTPVDPTTFPAPLVEGFVALNKSQEYPDYQSFNLLLNEPSSVLPISSFLLTYTDEICQELYDGTEGHETLFSLLFLLYPESSGNITLNSTNPKDYPVIRFGYFSDDTDLENYAKYAKDFTQILDTDYFKSVDAKLIVPKTCGCGDENSNKDYWRCYVLCMMASGYHFAGTCSMGSVVDSNLRVYGVQRLRVADASVMPKVTGANTNAPTIMIGEKISDVIKAEYY